MNLFPQAVRQALKEQGVVFEYDAGEGKKGQVWFDKNLNKVMYVLDKTIVGSMSVKQAKMYGTIEYIKTYGL